MLPAFDGSSSVVSRLPPVSTTSGLSKIAKRSWVRTAAVAMICVRVFLPSLSFCHTWRRDDGDLVDGLEIDQEFRDVRFRLHAHDITAAAAVVEKAIDRVGQAVMARCR